MEHIYQRTNLGLCQKDQQFELYTLLEGYQRCLEREKKSANGIN